MYQLAPTVTDPISVEARREEIETSLRQMWSESGPRRRLILIELTPMINNILCEICPG